MRLPQYLFEDVDRYRKPSTVQEVKYGRIQTWVRKITHHRRPRPTVKSPLTKYNPLRQLAYLTRIRERTYLRFLDLPREIRDQIYAYVLAPLESFDNDPHPKFDGRVLFTNRQILAESSEIFRLFHDFILVKANDPSFAKELFKFEVPIIARDLLKMREYRRLAMTLEFYDIGSDWPSTSIPVFVIIAAALPRFFELFRMPWNFRNMDAFLSLTMVEYPGHKQEARERLLIDAITESPNRYEWHKPRFLGIEIKGFISETRTKKLHAKLVGSTRKQDARDHWDTPISMQRVALHDFRARKYKDALNYYTKAIRYGQMLWVSHLEAIQESDNRMQLYIWNMCAGLYADKAQTLIIKAAKTSHADSLDVIRQARQVLEEGISFLNSKDPAGLDKPDEQKRRSIASSQAKISFRAAMACQALGDRDAALEYLRQALLYEPEGEDSDDGVKNTLALFTIDCKPKTGDELRVMIDELSEEKQTGERHLAILWKENII